MLSHREIHALLCAAVATVAVVATLRSIVLPMLLGLRGRRR